MQNLEFVLQQMHTSLMALTSYEANDVVANSLKNPLEAWRRLQKRYDPTTGGRKRLTFSERSFLLDGALFWNSKREIERWESFVLRFEKKLKNKLEDEIKLTGLEALVSEELEKHLILNSESRANCRRRRAWRL